MDPESKEDVGATDGERPPAARFRGSLSALTLAGIGLVATLLVTYAGPSGASMQRREAFLCDAAHQWRARYANIDDLQVIVTDVRFRHAPGQFVVGEGAVIAPVATELNGAQEVLDVRGLPAPVRVMNVEGTRLLAWEYAGTLHRDLRYVGLALVRRAQGRPVAMPDSPTFEKLADPWRVDARLTAAELEEEEHHLQQCQAFAPWVKAAAGEPPYTAQLLRIVQRLSGRSSERKRGEDVCAAIRLDAFTPHQAQVVAVMAMRQLGAPALGLVTADPTRMYLAGTYVDRMGWITVDVNDPDRGFWSGGSPIVTVAPLPATFGASQHGFWYASAAAYGGSRFGQTSPMSVTRWSTKPSDTDDVTVPSSVALAAVCP